MGAFTLGIQREEIDHNQVWTDKCREHAKCSLFLIYHKYLLKKEWKKWKKIKIANDKIKVKYEKR